MAENIKRLDILGQVETVVESDKLDSDLLVVDVRSAAEFADGSIPGSINMPLFDEDERSVIGTIYKYGGRDKAVDQGFQYAEKKLSQMLSVFAPYRNRRLAVLCARGGMRSRSVANLLLQNGYDACQVRGGYKQYRNGVLQVVDNFSPHLIIIHGMTGTGKTRIIQKLQNAIDLEEMAQHRSSLFGAIDRIPCNQRMFESHLAEAISTLQDEPYFIEGESRKIGQVFIPKKLAMAMKDGIMVRVDCSLEERVRRIIDDYPVEDEKTIIEVDEILVSLTWKLGKDKVQKMRSLLAGDEIPELVRMLLVDYYDKRYARSMRDYRYELELSSENIDEAARRLTQFRKTLLK